MTRFCTILLPASALLIAAQGDGAPSRSSAPPATSYLADSAVLARVDDRVIRVRDFCVGYFATGPDTRPSMDSLGRVELLTTMVDKEVMGLEARASGRTLEAHDELLLSQYEYKLLALGIYRRRVDDSAVVTEKDLRDLYAEGYWEQRLRYLLLPDRVTAEFVHDQLRNGRITWKQAARRYSLGPDSLAEGDLGWKSRSDLSGEPVLQILRLRPPGVSDPLRDADGYKIWQCLDRRPVPSIPYPAARRLLYMEISQERKRPLQEAFFNEMRARVKPTYDTANVAWLAQRFQQVNQGLGGPDPSGVDLRSRVPQLMVSDTSRVVARARGEIFTAGRLVETYRDTPPLGRQRIVTTSAVFDMLERIVLEPTIVAYAREQGLARAPDIVAEMDRQRESMLVDQLYRDSVDARIDVTPAMRRRYYQDHQHEFRTRERVRYALIPRVSEAGADSVIARLRAHETPQSILAADSVGGMQRGSIRELLEGQPHVYRSLLFEELHTGESTKLYLGRDKLWVVFYILSHEVSRPMTYDEVAETVAESVENVAAEQLLTGMLKRLRRRHRVEAHPEWVMRVNLLNPGAEFNVPSGD